LTVRNIVSFGAGVNTGAMLALLQLRHIKIDECVYADTKTNWDSEYRWIEQEAKPWMEKQGIKFTVVSSHYETSFGKGSLYGHCFDRKIIPSVSKRECTDKFKIKPIVDYIKNAYPNDLCFLYIGYDADEPYRAKRLLDWKERNKKTKRDNFTRLPYVPVYPLLQYGVTRSRCKELIQGLGLRVPEKSRCFICPFMKAEGFERLYREEPHNFEKALLLEENCSRFKDVRSAWCLLANRSLELRRLMQRIDEQTLLTRFVPVPRLMLEFKASKVSSFEGEKKLEAKK
jgi:hypothetical protein